MRTLVVIPCGGIKIWDKVSTAGPTEARLAYKGSPFVVNLEYAEKFADQWVILSAKYGFIDGDFVIPENYNVTFIDPETDPISIARLREQVQERLTDFDCVVALGSTKYADIVTTAFEDTGIQVITPTAGLRIGISNGTVKNATITNKPFVCS